MNKLTIEPFAIIGIAIKTTNNNGQSSKDIPALWNKFISENLIKLIPNKIDDTLYCIYTEYEGDYTQPYTIILGCAVSNLVNVPDNMIGKLFEGGTYGKRTVKGNIFKGLVFDEWTKIWKAAMPRAYTADFEVYGEKAKNPEDAEVDIFISIK